MVAAMLILYVAAPFALAQVLCAIYGTCKGHVRQGMLLLGAFSLVIGLSYWIMWNSISSAIETTTGGMQRQTEEMQKQIQRQMH
jgi:hypothetical protein